jgi:hypothetical protein
MNPANLLITSMNESFQSHSATLVGAQFKCTDCADDTPTDRHLLNILGFLGIHARDDRAVAATMALRLRLGVRATRAVLEVTRAAALAVHSSDL